MLHFILILLIFSFDLLFYLLFLVFFFHFFSLGRQAQPSGRWIELARLSLIRREYAFMYSKLLRRSNDTGNFVFNVNAKVDSAVLTKLFRYEMILPIRAVVSSSVRPSMDCPLVCLSLCLSVCQLVCVSSVCLSVCLSIHLPIHSPFYSSILVVYLSVQYIFSACHHDVLTVCLLSAFTRPCSLLFILSLSIPFYFPILIHFYLLPFA